MLTCVFAWLHLDLYLGSKNSNSFHWTKFWYVMLHSKVVRNIPGMVWVHSLNYIIIYDEGRKNASCTVQRFWCRFKKSRSFLFKCCFFFVNIRIWQNDAMVSIHITVFCPQFQKVMFYYPCRVRNNELEIDSHIKQLKWIAKIFNLIFLVFIQIFHIKTI